MQAVSFLSLFSRIFILGVFLLTACEESTGPENGETSEDQIKETYYLSPDELAQVQPRSDSFLFVSDLEGKVFEIGDTVVIQWVADLEEVGDAVIEFSPDGGNELWANISQKESLSPNDSSWGNVKWVIPDTVETVFDGKKSTITDQAVILVRPYQDQYGEAVSDTFSIKP